MVEVSEPVGRLVVGEVERGGVLDGQDGPAGGQLLDGVAAEGVADVVGVDGGVVEEAVGGLGGGPAAGGLGDAGLGAGRGEDVVMPATGPSDVDATEPGPEGRDPTDQTLLEPSSVRASRPRDDGRRESCEAAPPPDVLVTTRSLYAMVDPGNPYAEGAMGTIVLARDELLGRSLVLKILHEKHRDNPELRGRFLREASITAQLQHPGIPPVFNVGTLSDGRPFFTMRLVEGQTLARRLSGSTDLAADRPRFLTIFEQVCQTVAFAHARGVIHRDLKPENIVLGEYGSVYVMDWGIARLVAKAGTCRRGRRAMPPVTLNAEETVAWTGRALDSTTLEANSRRAPSRATCSGPRTTCRRSRPEAKPIRTSVPTSSAWGRSSSRSSPAVRCARP